MQCLAAYRTLHEGSVREWAIQALRVLVESISDESESFSSVEESTVELEAALLSKFLNKLSVIIFKERGSILVLRPPFRVICE